VELRCGSSTQALSKPRSLDAVLTDPPYFANVQYAELMDFCYVWLRRLVDGDDPAFVSASTRNPDELTGNATMKRDLEHFTAGLSDVFVRMARALKAGAPLAFTYHHNRLEAYLPVAVAILDAELVCSASLPCPAEMGGSIHIHSTSSSILDTVFVCRAKGAVKRRWLAETPEDVVRLVEGELEQLRMAGVRVTRGDARCIAFGHVVRMAIWRLRDGWDRSVSWVSKLERIERTVSDFDAVEALISEQVERTSRQGSEVREARSEYDSRSDEEVSF
jgi:adenine-specific DNA methylase